MKEEKNKLEDSKNIEAIEDNTLENKIRKYINDQINKIIPYNIALIKVSAFVGPSGTGKSYRAQQVAFENNIEAIIDDGLLIRQNNVVAGVSAKKATTKAATVRAALFSTDEEKKNIIEAIKKNKIKSILILGTSVKMVKRIANNLKLPEISNYIYIEDVATQEEMRDALKMRKEEGKHIIPVPTFEIKKDFSGILADPLHLFKRSQKSINVTERTIIRPTFSYLGKYDISNTVFKEIVYFEKKKIQEIVEILKLRISRNEDNQYMEIYVEVKVKFGTNFKDACIKFQHILEKEIEKISSSNSYITIKVKEIEL